MNDFLSQNRGIWHSWELGADLSLQEKYVIMASSRNLYLIIIL